ncbi:MAG: molybdopterin-dependent oxidoreductase [Actinobacteria bacterium]|nr:molybdopterin-dependent oxidoreductase [Actinomycetota bacterium]
MARLQERFASPLHDDRLAAILGIALGVTFTTCFVTGLVSHTLQHPPSWFTWPSRPAGLFRVTQGVHVATGIASIPLLLAKLWVVYPKLYRWPPVASVAHAVERISLVPLVGGALFQLFTGTANIAYWYRPMPFFFTVAHFWAAWITIGALVVHVGAKLTATRAALARRPAPVSSAPVEAARDGLTRRGFIGTVAAASGVLVVATVGETLRPLNRVSVLAPRRLGVGPQGRPVNRSAAAAGVLETARDPEYRFRVEGRVRRPLELSLDELRAMPQHEAVLPIACVEGWSYSARWRGVRVRDLLHAAGAHSGAGARVESLEAYSIYGSSPLNHLQAHDPDTLLALELDGHSLALDHGYPLRLIGPNRPGVDQTKWVHRMVVL